MRAAQTRIVLKGHPHLKRNHSQRDCSTRWLHLRIMRRPEMETTVSRTPSSGQTASLQPRSPVRAPGTMDDELGSSASGSGRNGFSAAGSSRLPSLRLPHGSRRRRAVRCCPGRGEVVLTDSSALLVYRDRIVPRFGGMSACPPSGRNRICSARAAPPACSTGSCPTVRPDSAGAGSRDAEAAADPCPFRPRRRAGVADRSRLEPPIGWSPSMEVTQPKTALRQTARSNNLPTAL